MKKLILKIILSFILTGSMAANAAVIIDVTEQSGDVFFDITGSLDLTSATSAFSGPIYNLGFISGGDNWYVASGSGGAWDSYALTGFDGAFGTSLTFFNSPTSTSGDDFFIWGQGGATEQVGVGSGYVSGDSIISQMIFAGSTIDSLSMNEGVYNYLLPSDTITLNISTSSVPEPSVIALFGLGLLGLGFTRRKNT